MIHFTYWKPGLLLFAVAAVGTAVWTKAMAIDRSMTAETIKATVAQVVAGLNAHDPIETTAYAAPDVISMECGSPSTVGIEADREGFRMDFQHDPLWKVSLIDETVDVARGGDMAVYRGTYNEDNGSDGVLMTHKTNFIAEFKRQWLLEDRVVQRFQYGTIASEIIVAFG
jgi:ketosteroid isomerase-like protein